MRPNNSNKRTRGRSRSKNTNPLARSYESNGPDVKIRGSALQVADKYAQLARDAQSAGDRVMAENYFQHAEHYYRIVAQAYEQNNQNQQMRGDRRDDERGHMRDDRQPYRGGEQPTINGFDGLEDDDEGMRRALRVNGHHANGGAHRSDDADDDGPYAGASEESDQRPSGNTADDDDEAEVENEVVEAAAPAPTRRRSRAKAEDADSAPAAEAAAEGAEDGEEAPKPRRRTRSGTPRRTRSRAAATDAAPAPEASEPTS